VPRRAQDASPSIAFLCCSPLPSSLNPALDAANFKLRRATEHLHTLTEEMLGFRKRDPYAVTVDFEPDTGWWVAKAQVREEPSPRLSVLVGEIAYECLSALNHLVWELAVRKIGRNKAAKGSVRNFVQFPVATSPANWAEIPLVRKQPVSKKALGLMEGLQPYNGRDGQAGVSSHPLSLIRDVANADKHRVLAVAFAYAEFSGIRWTWDTEHADGPESEWLVKKGQRLDYGSPLSRIRFGTGNAEANVGVEGKPTADVVFSTEHWSIQHRTLLRCTTWSTRAWQTLAPLFPPK
jgi:hypothetical protein